MAATAFGLLLSLAVCQSMPLDLEFANHIESFIELPGNDHPELMNIINELGTKQAEAKTAQEKRLQDEAVKVTQISDAANKQQEDLKAVLADFQKKMTEAEKKVADAEAKIAPARDEVMKNIQAESAKKITDQQAAGKAAADDFAKKTEDEKMKIETATTEWSKRFEDSSAAAKANLDGQLAEAGKKLEETHKKQADSTAEMDKKMADFNAKFAEDSKHATDDQAKVTGDIHKVKEDEKAKIKGDADANMAANSKALEDAQAKIPAGKDEVKQGLLPQIEALQKENTDLGSKLSEQTKQAFDAASKVKSLENELKSTETKAKQDVDAKVNELGRLVTQKESDVARVERETNDMKSKLNSFRLH
jgi:chromosome segregation ATPase